MYAVYRISSLKSPSVYYGFCTVDKDPLDQFLHQAEGPPERGDAQYVANCGGRHALSAESLEQFDHQIEALFARNAYRSKDKKSYTRPSNWPGPNFTDLKDRRAYALHRELLRARTARDAYAAGMWVAASINLIGMVCGRNTVLHDLDHLNPVEFDEKYFA